MKITRHKAGEVSLRIDRDVLCGLLMAAWQQVLERLEYPGESESIRGKWLEQKRALLDILYSLGE